MSSEAISRVTLVEWVMPKYIHPVHSHLHDIPRAIPCSFLSSCVSIPRLNPSSSGNTTAIFADFNLQLHACIMMSRLCFALLALFAVSQVWAGSQRHEPGSWSTLTLETSASVAEAERLAASNATCPPPGFKSLEPFSVPGYLGRWYVQAQMPVLYLPPISSYCVTTFYSPVNPVNLTEGLIVENYAEIGQVNGIPQNPVPLFGPFLGNITNSIFQLRARVVNASNPSALSVGPAFPGPIAQLLFRLLGRNDVPAWLQGDYWVVAAGPGKSTDPDFQQYEWAIITGGPPNTKSGDACRTGNVLPPTVQVNNVGYWLFTREQVPPPALIAEMKQIGASLGLDNSVLMTVAQEGCNYNFINRG